MEAIVLSLIHGVLQKDMEIRKYSFDMCTAFHLNRKINNSQYFQNITVIQLLVTCITFAWSGNYITTLLPLLVVYHILLFRGEYVDIVNARNYYPKTVSTIIEYGLAAFLAASEMIITIMSLFLHIERIYLLLLQLAFYLGQFLCFVIAEKRILKRIDKKQIRILPEMNIPVIKVKPLKSLLDGEEYGMEKHFICRMGKNKYIILNRDFRGKQVFDLKNKECYIGRVPLIYLP